VFWSTFLHEGKILPGWRVQGSTPTLFYYIYHHVQCTLQLRGQIQFYTVHCIYTKFEGSVYFSCVLYFIMLKATRGIYCKRPMLFWLSSYLAPSPLPHQLADCTTTCSIYKKSKREVRRQQKRMPLLFYPLYSCRNSKTSYAASNFQRFSKRAKTGEAPISFILHVWGWGEKFTLN
jgi:hypothetical protein